MNKRIIYILFFMINIMVAAFEMSEKKIGVILSSSENPFFKDMEEGALDKAKQINVNLEIVYSEKSPVNELRIIKRFIEEGIDIVVINPSNSEATSKGVLLLNEAKIPVITIDREVARGEVETHIGSNNLMGGALAGDYLLEKLGVDANIIELQGNYNTSASVNRTLGFNQAFGSKFKRVLRKNGRFEKKRSYTVIKRVLSEELEIDGIFAHNDESALGAAQAVAESGRDILIVGFDGTDEGEEAIRTGMIGATIKQNPYDMGYLGVEMGAKKLKNEWINKKRDIDVYLVDKETLAN